MGHEWGSEKGVTSIKSQCGFMEEMGWPGIWKGRRKKERHSREGWGGAVASVRENAETGGNHLLY